MASTQSTDSTKESELREKFLGGMSHAACTVNIVTTDGPAGKAGVTVSAMSSVSADTPKPTLLVCVHQMSPAADKILENGVFCVNVLRDDQSYISDTFAGRFRDQVEDKFDCAQWTTQVTGAPRVVDPLVSFDCQVTSSDKVGTHYVLFGEVQDIYVAERGSPLIYANRAYGSTSRIDPTVSIDSGTAASARGLSIGCVHTFGPYILPELISGMTAENHSVDLKLVEGDQRRVQESLLAGEVDLAFLYDIDLTDELEIEALTELVPYVLIAEGHEFESRTSLTPSDLAGHPMILLDVPPSRAYFSGILENAGVEPQIAFKSASFEMVRGMVGHGLGYTILATKPASSMTYDGRALVTRPLLAEMDASRVVLASRKRVPLSGSAKSFQILCQSFFNQKQSTHTS